MLKWFRAQIQERFKLDALVSWVIFLLPVYLIRFKLGQIPTNLFEFLAGMSIVWFLLIRQVFKIDLGGVKTYLAPICLIIFGVLLSTLLNGSYSQGFGILKGWFVMPIFFAWVATEVLLKKKLLKSMYYSGMGVAAVAWIYFLLGELTYDGRLKTFYNSPNYLAMFLVPTILIGSVFWKENKIRHSIELAIASLALYWTFSYAAWLAVLSGLMLVAFFQTGRLSWKNIASFILVGSLIILGQMDTSKWNDLWQLKERSSLSSRMMIWRSAGKIIADNPLWGIGPGNFQNKYLEYQKYYPPYLEWAVPEPHNLWLAFWLQTGFLGLLGFLILLYQWSKVVIRSLKDSPEKEMIAVGAIMLATLTHGLLDTPYFKNDLAVIFWLVIFMGIKNASALKHSSNCLKSHRHKIACWLKF